MSDDALLVHVTFPGRVVALGNHDGGVLNEDRRSGRAALHSLVPRVRPVQRDSLRT